MMRTVIASLIVFLIFQSAAIAKTFELDLYVQTDPRFLSGDFFRDYRIIETCTVKIADEAIGPNEFININNPDFKSFSCTLPGNVGTYTFSYGADVAAPDFWRGQDDDYDYGLLFDGAGNPLRFDSPQFSTSNLVGWYDIENRDTPEGPNIAGAPFLDPIVQDRFDIPAAVLLEPTVILGTERPRGDTVSSNLVPPGGNALLVNGEFTFFEGFTDPDGNSIQGARYGKFLSFGQTLQPRSLKITDVLVTQAVLGDDEPIDLVMDRKTSIVVGIEAKSITFETIATLRACIADSNGVCDQEFATRDVDLTLVGPNKFSLTFTTDPSIFPVGESRIVVELDPENEITPESPDDKVRTVSVDITETKRLKLQYTVVIPRGCEDDFPPIGVDCSIDVGSPIVGETIDAANTLVQDIFPLPDNGIDSVLSPSSIKSTADDFRTFDISFADGRVLSASFAIRVDWQSLYWNARLRGSNAKRIVGLVPEGYFNLHLKSDVKGVAPDSFFTPTVVISTLGRPDTVAHELGHTFGFREEGYGGALGSGVEVQGFSPRLNSLVSGRDFMGASTDGQTYWISNQRWIDLIPELSKSAIDPELLIFGANVNRDGTIELLDWFTVSGLPDFVRAGDYTVVLRDEDGSEISTVPFDLSFRMFVEPFGVGELEEDLLLFAIPYPSAAASVEIVGPGGTDLVIVDPAVKLLRDAVLRIPDVCFVNDVALNRQALEEVISEFDNQLEFDNPNAAIRLLEVDLVGLLNSSVLPNCDEVEILDETKEEVLELVDNTIARIDARFVGFDQDVDDVPDAEDSCVNSDLSASVVLNACDSGVENFVLENGCSISDEIQSCDVEGVSPEQFASCVSGVTGQLVSADFLLLEEEESILACIPEEPELIPGDLDLDGDVDRDDLTILLASRNQPADGPDDPKDLDGDGTITGLDARKLTQLCTRPRCATN